MSNNILLESENLVKTFGDFHTVDGLNLQVCAGEMVGLVGPDGAGKTTAIRLMCGVLRPTSGVVRVAGYEVPGQVEMARQQIGYLAQQFGLYGDLSVQENIEFFGEVFNVPESEVKERAAELLNFAGLGDFTDRPAAKLSGGMQKKLGLASTLIHRPKVLLLDEPTGGVDPVARQEFWHLLITLLRSGSAVLVSTPYMDEAMRFNRVIFMDHGRVLTQGAPRELMKQLEGQILELDADDQITARGIAEDDPEVEDVHTFGNHIHLRVKSAKGPMERIPPRLQSANIPMDHIIHVPATLEDVFIHLIETEGAEYEQPNPSA